MKQVLFLIIYLLIFVSATFSQQTTEQAKEVKTKLEAFQARTGVVIIRGFSEIGTVQGLYNTSIKVESKEFTDASNGRKEYGITIQVKDNSRSYERENTSYIDYDEIESLIKGIDYIANIDGTVTQLSNFQADYRTKDDLTFATFSSRSEILFAVQSGRISSASAYFKLVNIADIRKLLVDAKEKIDSIKPATKTGVK